MLALAAGPVLVITRHRTITLPWAKLWSLPIARSAEPSRFIVFGILALAIALAVWLAAPVRSRLLRGARWGLGLLAVAVLITDAPTSYQAVNPAPPGYTLPSTARPVNQLPAFITQGLYRQYLRPGEIVAVITARGNAGMLFQAAANFYFRIAGGYINASLTPVNAVPHQLTLVANPSKGADRDVRGLPSLGRGGRHSRRAGLGVPVDTQLDQPWPAWHGGGRRHRLPGRSLARPPGSPGARGPGSLDGVFPTGLSRRGLPPGRYRPAAC